jgi:DNA-binding response OmpR family regulator
VKLHSKPDPHATPVVDRGPSVLIVDADRVSERAVELALAQCDYATEWARDGDSALDIMRRSRTDVVIADSVLSDMSGATLMRRTFDLCGPGAPPFIFVTVDRAITTRVGLLAAGAADFLVKPFAADELRARVINTLEARRPRAVTTPGFTGIAGDCSSVPIADLLAMLEFGHKSGTVHVSVGVATGRLVIDAGRVVHAELGTLSGSDAFFALLRANGELFRFELGDATGPHTLNARVSDLLLESAVRVDTDKHWIGEHALRRTEAGLRELGMVKTPIKLRSRLSAGTPSSPPSRIPAAQRFAIAIADPFMLGDLVLASEVSPGATSPAPQLRIELWAALTEGVLAMLSLASPPGYRLVIAALQGDCEHLHLRFEGPSATLVVTLIDAGGDRELPASAPDGIVVAPPRGELVALAPQRLAELTGRVTGDDALAVLAVGGPALQTTVERLTACDGPPRCVAVSSALETDLRDMLCRLIRLWIARSGDAA